MNEFNECIHSYAKNNKICILTSIRTQIHAHRTIHRIFIDTHIHTQKTTHNIFMRGYSRICSFFSKKNTILPFMKFEHMYTHACTRTNMHARITLIYIHSNIYIYPYINVHTHPFPSPAPRSLSRARSRCLLNALFSLFLFTHTHSPCLSLCPLFLARAHAHLTARSLSLSISLFRHCATSPPPPPPLPPHSSLSLFLPVQLHATHEPSRSKEVEGQQQQRNFQRQQLRRALRQEFANATKEKAVATVRCLLQQEVCGGQRSGVVIRWWQQLVC